MRTKRLVILVMMLSVLAGGVLKAKKKRSQIELAILLDTSGSMEGLIEQAKTQLWKIVNELAIAKRDGITPDLKVALYVLGCSGRYRH